MELIIDAPTLTDYQKSFMYNDARVSIIIASTKCGKTFALIWWLFEEATNAIDPDGKHYFWIAPTHKQAEIAYKRLKRNLVTKGFHRFNDSQMFIHCPNGAIIQFKTGEVPDNIYGDDAWGVVIDEAPRCRPEIWDAVRSIVTATEAPIKMIGNFGGVSNWVSKLKDKAEHDDNYEFFKVTCWDAVDAGILSREEVDQAKLDLHPKSFASLYEAEAIEGDDQLISYESIKKLFTNTHLDGGIKYITCDPAFTGRDKAVIMVWDGLRVERIITYDTSDINVIVDRIKALKNEYNVNGNNVIVDADGVGAGVVSYLPGCIRFNNNGKAIGQTKRQYTNIKSQCMFKMVSTINANEVYIKSDFDIERAIIEELEWVRLPKEIDDQKVRTLSKDEIKKGLGRSPDYADCLLLRFRKEIGSTGKYMVSGLHQNSFAGRTINENKNQYKVI